MEISDRVYDELVRQGREDQRRERKKIRLERCTLAAVVFYAGVTFLMWCVMRQDMHLAHRAWVGTPGDTLKTGPIVFESNGDARMPYEVTVRNYSDAIAQDVGVDAFLARPLDGGAVDEIQNKVRASAEASGTVLIFPSNETTINYSAFIGASQLAQIPRDDQGRIAIELFICIAYRDQFGAWHHTPMHYMSSAPFIPSGNVGVGFREAPGVGESNPD